jgi:hypothetical protein
VNCDVTTLSLNVIVMLVVCCKKTIHRFVTNGVRALLRTLAAAHFLLEICAWDGVAVPLIQPPAVMTTTTAALMSTLSATWKLASASMSVMHCNPSPLDALKVIVSWHDGQGGGCATVIACRLLNHFTNFL